MLATKVKAKGLDSYVRQIAEIPEAIQRTVIFSLNDTVDDLHKRQLIEMEMSFDRVTPYVKRGLRKRYAAGRSRAGFKAPSVRGAGVYFEEFGGGMPPNDVVAPHVFGGPRKQKKNERRLGDAIWRDGEGNSYNLGAGYYGIMANGYPRNKYGNITQARYSEMLPKLGTIDTAKASPGKKGNKSSKKGYFIKTTGGYPSAVMERTGNKVKTMLVLTRKAPTYKKRYKFFDVAESQIRVSLPRHFNRILQKEIRRRF